MGRGEYMLLTDEGFMHQALEQAKIAYTYGEVPVGAVIVKDNKVIAKGYNFREQQKTPLGHAEIMAIQSASEYIGDWRLTGCTIYVTLEPCPMCMGAIINARIDRVCYGAVDENGGCCGSLIQLADCGFAHRPRIKAGVLKEECGEIITNFFKAAR